MVKVGIIGLGYWGPNLLRNFYNHPEVEIAGICDINPQRIKKILKKYRDIKFATTDYRELLKKENDLIVIATPPETHFKLAKDSILKGKHVFVEKPLTNSSKESEILIELSTQKNIKIFVDHTFVFHPVVRRIKQLLNNNTLGDIYYFDSERINLGLLQYGVNVIWDLAVHDFSIISYLFPEVKFIKIKASGTKHIHPHYEDMAHVIIESDSNFIAHIHVSWLSPVKIRKIIIGGNKQMLWWDDVHPYEKLKIYNSKIELNLKEEDPFFPNYIKGEIITIPVENYETLFYEINEVIESLTTDKNPEVDALEGLKIVKLLEACDKSLKKEGKGILLK